jgi:tetratricopeptide (TPR) repeat protein
LLWAAQALLWQASSHAADGTPASRIEYDRAELEKNWRAATDARIKAEAQYQQDTRAAYEQAFSAYHAARRAFLAATASNDVRAMDIALAGTERTYRQLHAIYRPGAVPADLPTAAPPDDLRGTYLRAQTGMRDAWIARLRMTATEAVLVRAMAGHADFEFHTELLERASTNNAGIPTLPWLETVYTGLADQAPCTLAFWYGLSSAQYLQGRMRAANRTLHSAVTLFPDSLYVHYLLARTCATDPVDTARAIAHLRWLTENTNERTWLCKAHTELARRYVRAGDYAAAQQSAAQAVAQINPARDIALLPMYVSARRSQCTALLKTGKTDAAVAALVDAARTAARDLAIQQDVAALYFSLATADEAVNPDYAAQAVIWLKKVAQMSPAPANAYLQLAQLSLRMEQTQAAEAYATQALASAPGSPSVLTTLGFVYRAQGRNDTARTLFEKALALDPTCAAAREGLNALDDAAEKGSARVAPK